MNKLNYILPLLIVIGFNTLGIASESGDESSSSSSSSSSSKGEPFSVTKADLEWLLERVIEDLTETEPAKKKVSWLSVTDQFRDAHIVRCADLDDKTLSDKLSIKFANYYRAKTGAGNRTWKQRCSDAGIDKGSKESKDEEKLKKAPAPKRDREEEKEEGASASSSSSESDDDGSAPSSSSRAKKEGDLTEEDLTTLVKLAFEFLKTSGRQVLDWEKLAGTFRDEIAKEETDDRFGFLTDEDLRKKLKSKFRSIFVNGRRKDEWKKMRLEAGFRVAKSPQERVIEKRKLADQKSASEVEVVKEKDENPAPLKKAASAMEAKAPVTKAPTPEAPKPTTTLLAKPVTKIVFKMGPKSSEDPSKSPKPAVLNTAKPVVTALPTKPSEDSSVMPPKPAEEKKKPDSYILSLLPKHTDDAFMRGYVLAIKAGQKCENCVQNSIEQPLLLFVLKAKRFALFKRMVQLPSGATILENVGPDGKTIKQTLIDYCMANACFEVLPVLIGGDTLWTSLANAFVNGQISKEQFTDGVGQQNVTGVIQKRFSAALKDGREAEIEFWFNSGLFDWSSEVVIEVDTDEPAL